VYYLEPEDATAKALVVHIKNNTSLTTEDEESADDYSFLSSEDAQHAFKDVPEALNNLQKLIDSCTLELVLGKWVFPNYPKEDGKDYDTMLREKVYREAPERGIELVGKLQERIDYELSVIAKKGYSPYFLVVSDLMQHARNAQILTNTRGSAAGSFVSYVTGITTVNPIEYNLPFERFLNPERPSAPDIDMDVADDKRDEFIEYARQKYGENHVAQIGTFGTMAARAAVKDVARALGQPYSVGDRISKMIPFGAQGFPMTIDKAMDQEQELADLFKKDPVVRQVISLAKKIEGNARHMGVHAAGVVMAPTPVTDFTPIQLDPKGGKIITQYDMYSVEEAGLLKFDFLGLKNLSVLADSIKRVKRIQNIDIDIHRIPLDNEKVFTMLSQGRTMGVFQFASSGMTKYLIELQPTRVDDLNAMVALYRPGPMEFIPEYIARKRDPSRVVFLDPRMKEILEKSYGIITYQDDVLMIAINLAGYSWLDADKFRKAMGKKIPEEMAAQKDKFMSGCRERGMKEQVVQKLWEQIETFAAYGFNKSHAASYGNLAYKTAYMKANYPLEYMSALLTADSGDVEKIAEIVAECKAMGIDVLPPDVNESYEVFSVVTTAEKPTIRFGLISIKNFGEGIAHTIVEERKSNGPFKDLSDFLTRIVDKNLNKKSLESLIKSGALDRFGERGMLLHNIETLTSFHREVHAPASAQDSLFGATVVTLTLEPWPASSLTEMLVWEKELLGLYVSGHPLDDHRSKLVGKPTIADTKHRMHAGISTVIAGLVEDVRTILTKKGDKMAFVKMSDYTDGIESVFFPEAFAKAKDVLVPGSCIMIKGKVSNRNDEKSFMADAAKKL
jgi:DNA polymerase-3 subunit alpha